MELKELKPREINLSEDYIGFPSIHEELRDIVNYLGHLVKSTQDGKDDYRRMLTEAECGSLFLGRTGAGKTHALHCVVNEAAKLGYHPLDGSLMLGKAVVDPRDVREFFDACRQVAKDKSILIVYDDARQLLGSRGGGMYGMRYDDNSRETRPMLGEFRRQIDGLQFFDHPTYIIVTSATSVRHIDRQIARRFSRHVSFPRPQDKSRRALFDYYIRRFGYDPVSLDIVTLSYLMDGVVTGRIEEIVSKASYKADLAGGLTNKQLVREIIRFLQGPPADIHHTEEEKTQTGYHEFGGHTLPAYSVGLEPILVTIEPSADGTFGKSFHRHSDTIPQSSAKYHFADIITSMGSTAVYTELEKSKEEGRMSDLARATRTALNLYALKNPLVQMSVGREDTYLSLGLFSEENRVEIEAEIDKIKNAALKIAQEIIRDYEGEISTFTNDHLIKNEIMVRSEIIDVLKEMGVEPGRYYGKMCESLGKLGYPV
jgi:ATP-dependent Zn protease